MYMFAFNRNQIGPGAASALMMMLTVVADDVRGNAKAEPWLKSSAPKQPEPG